MQALTRFRPLLAAWWPGYAAALAAVALVSLFIGVVLGHVRLANISLLYLLAVFFAALAFGSGPAVLASLAGFLTFDWFFVEPLHQFTISDPEEWVALLFFLVTALITGQLTAAVRRRAVLALQREREATVLYDVVRLMSEGDIDRALAVVADRLRLELGLTAVAIDLADGDRVAAHASSGSAPDLALARSAALLPKQMLNAGPAPTGDRRGDPGQWVRILPSRLPGRDQPGEADGLRLVPVKSGDRRVGMLTLVQPAGAPAFRRDENRLLSALGTQLGLATERLRLQREATEAEILRRTDELKTALLNAVSHDLRTPLASIIASAGSLRQRDVHWTDDEQQEFAEAIEEEAQRLDRIVGNLLDLSRIEDGSLRPERGWYDLGALVDDVLGRLRPRTAQHRIAASVPADLPPVLLDYIEIDQVLSNLIENAVKYTPAGTDIQVDVQLAGGEVRVDVADRGPGIPPAALPRLFERFYRVDAPGPRPHGTGVGLTVARGLVEAHGGRIWAEHRTGGGTRFVFTLPLAAPAGVPPTERAPT